MRSSRETIYQGFFNALKTNTALASLVTTFTRRSVGFSDIPPEQQPFLYVEQVGENQVNASHGMPYNWQLDVTIGLFVYSADLDVPPSGTMNPIVDAIEMAIPGGGNFRFASDTNTLGIPGVADVRLTGEGKASMGQLGNQAFAFVPARIFAI